MTATRNNSASDVAEQIIGTSILEADDRAYIMEGVEVAANALLAEETLTPSGLQAAVKFLNTNLHNYEAIQTDRKRYPDIARESIVKPWVVLGVPRGGTTFLHALLAQDPANRSPETWETTYVSPPPVAETYDTDPRIEQWINESASGEAGTFRNIGDKEVMKRHMVGARLPQECGVMMMPMMRDFHIWALARVVNYVTWYMGTDLKPTYEFHKKWLQHMQWRNRRERWVLKCPNHALNLPALLQNYPDACIIQTHRSPAAALSSLASLIGNYRKTVCNFVDPHSLGMEMLLMIKAHTDRPMAYRRANSDKKIVDLSHREVVSDPIAAVRSIYKAFDAEISPDAERRMRAFIDNNPQGAHGEHKHNLESYGLSEGVVREVLSEYFTEFSDLF